MTITRFLISGAFTLIFAISIFSSCGSDVVGLEPELTFAEKETYGLLYMREEEKLARDVYIFFYDMYGMQIFDNISRSEQVHMDVILDLLYKYDLADSALEEMGKFTNQELQSLYYDLIELGSESLIAAFTVGATIEDVDIQDLNDYSTSKTPEDIINAYGLLNCGSRNHMRAFVRQLDNRGEDYSPQYITQEEFESVIQGEHEMCGQLFNMK